MNKSETQTRKKLIEHSLPLDAMNRASEAEKQIKVGKHTSIHQWFAPRPLSTNRAIIFGQYVDDPSAWPERFPTEADQDRERRRLHKVIANMVEWPLFNDSDQSSFALAIEEARWEIARSVAWRIGEEPPSKDSPAAVLAFLQTKAPPVYDPFCGGGSIPLEAQRLGLRAYGSDLNPVAVLITKSLIEFPPKFANRPPVHPKVQDELAIWKGAQGLAEDVRRYGAWIREEAEKRIGRHYPNVKLPDGREAKAIAWLWARTLPSPDPAQRGAHVPLASSYVLTAKDGKEAIVVPLKDAKAAHGWRFELRDKVSAGDVSSARNGSKDPQGTGYVCLLSRASIESDYIKEHGKLGNIDYRLMAVHVEIDGSRFFVGPDDAQESAARVEVPSMPELHQETPKILTGGTCYEYGLDRFDKLFTPRQLTCLGTFSDLIGEVRREVLKDSRRAISSDCDLPLADGGVGAKAYADAVSTYLAMCLNRMAQCQTSLNRWFDGRKIQPVFDKQAMAMVMDFAEGNPFCSSTGSWDAALKYPLVALERWGGLTFGRAVNTDAAKNTFPIKSAVFVTDPPYYNNIAYADLSDFFYVWLRRSLKEIHPDLFRRVLTSKSDELIAKAHRHGGRKQAEEHFIRGMKEALLAMRASTDDYPLSLYYAFKQSELKKDGVVSAGWAAFLEAICSAGLQVDGTWPVRTEHSSRSISQGANALASSVVLVCRKRPDNAPTIGRREFLRELKPIMESAIQDHQKAGIPLPDRRQAAIGPGIGVFSKYSMVREADDSAMHVGTALALINKEIDSLLAEGSEELDAETRFALEWYQMHGFQDRTGCAGDAISQLLAFNLSEARINATGIFRVKGGDAKLLTRDEMHAAVVGRYGKPWRPSLDDSFTVWELAQHMARTLGAPDGGIDAAGRLLAERRSAATDVLLIAERLFELATTRGENEEALVWNELQISWPEIENAADRAQVAGYGATPEQGQLGI